MNNLSVVTQFHAHGKSMPIGDKERITQLEQELEKANKRIDTLVFQVARILADKAGE